MMIYLLRMVIFHSYVNQRVILFKQGVIIGDHH